MTRYMLGVHPLVGLTGKKRSGKDTFAAVLVEEFGFTRVAFADPLKDAALALNPIVDVTTIVSNGYAVPDTLRLRDAVDEFGWERAKEIPEVRRTLQEYGHGIRGIDPDFWIRAAKTRIAAIDDPVVVTDVRYLTEADAIRELGGLIVKTIRPETEDRSDRHPSEVELESISADLDVFNIADVEALRRTARTVGETLLPR